jgi:hypothetical protein
MKADGPALGPVFFILAQLHINDISRNSMFQKNHFSINPGERLAFSSIIFYQYFFQNNGRFMLSHGAKVRLAAPFLLRINKKQEAKPVILTPE